MHYTTNLQQPVHENFGQEQQSAHGRGRTGKGIRMHGGLKVRGRQPARGRDGRGQGHQFDEKRTTIVDLTVAEPGQRVPPNVGRSTISCTIQTFWRENRCVIRCSYIITSIYFTRK